MGGDGFLFELCAVGAALVYSTYLGGSDQDQVRSLALDAGKNAYVAGATQSYDVPTHDAYQPTFGGGRSDGFLRKVTPYGGRRPPDATKPAGPLGHTAGFGDLPQSC